MLILIESVNSVVALSAYASLLQPVSIGHETALQAFLLDLAGVEMVNCQWHEPFTHLAAAWRKQIFLI